MRNDEPQPASRFVIGRAMPLVAEDSYQCSAGRRLVERGDQAVHKTLRPHPFRVKAGVENLLGRNQIGDCNRLPDLCEELTGRIGIEPDVVFEVQLHIVRIEASVLVIGAAAPVGCILPAKHRRLPADERPDLSKRGGPPRWVEHRVVDVANERGELLRLSHCRLRGEALPQNIIRPADTHQPKG